MDIEAFLLLDESKKTPYLKSTITRMSPILPMLTTIQLSNLAFMYVNTDFREMYSLICSEIQKRIRTNEPYMAKWMNENWKESEKGYDSE